MKKNRGRRFMLLFSSLFLLIGASCSTPSVVAESSQGEIPTVQGTVQKEGPIRATWLWDTMQIVDHTESILQFAATNQIGAIYLQINRDVKLPYYKEFIRKAGEQGVVVDIMDGRPAWGLSENVNQIAAFLDWVEAYQSQAEADERFAGIHLDIEPHVLPEWKTDQERVISEWQGNVRYIMNRATKMNMPVAADLPFWLDNYKIPGSEMAVSSWMIRQYDAVTIMAYRDTAKAIFDVAKTELAESAALGKKLSIAVETKQSKEGQFITFYEEGKAYMESQLKLVENMAKGYDSYSGISVHEYGTWKSLIP